MMEGKGGSAMTSIVVEARTGPDGRLHLDVPLGIDRANQPVRVVIESPRKAMTAEEWTAYVQSMAGSINDPTFERPPQLPLEERGPLS
jgi:hypothetical protein